MRWLVATLLSIAILAGPVTPSPVAQEAKDERDKGLRIRNRTPFLVIIYIGGIRSGWIRPFRTEVFKGLAPGKHKLYVFSRYGSSHWGPSTIWVPGTWNLTPRSGSQDTDMEAALTSRIYRSNRSSLKACDMLAERRGLELRGRRVDFEVEVDAKGKGTAKIVGAHLTKRLRSCYMAVTSQWTYPVTGVPYIVDFQHIH